MKISKQQKIKIVLGTLVFVLALLLGAFAFWRSTLPAYDGSQVFEALSAPVSITRDDFGIPHIRAQNELDLYRGMGFTVAQDRFWQMELFRRVMSGRLAEIFGTRGLPVDKMMRTLSIRQRVTIEAQNLPPEDYARIAAYCEGVNLYRTTARLPMEFHLLGIDPEPWAVADVLLVPKMLAYGLTWWQTDVFLGEIQPLISEAHFAELLPEYPPHAPTIIQPSGTATDGSIGVVVAPKDHKFAYAPIDPDFKKGLTRMRGLLGHGTSNSWVVSGSRTTTGQPILANDPHLIQALPAYFYEIHLQAPEMDVYGMTIPGAPGIVIGHNPAISWGITNGMLDDADLFIEKLHPDDPTRYRDGETWQPLRQRTETIAVLGEDAVILTVNETRHGPIISSVLEDSTRHVLSFRWMGYQQGQEIGAFMDVNKAHDWNSFRTALFRLTAPALNVVYADSTGNIGYQFAGHIPLRRQGTGRLPHPAWQGEFDWTGTAPPEENPHVLNPPSGYIATANNLPDPEFPHYINSLWEPTGRIERIHARLQQQELLSPEDLAAIQVDTYSTTAMDIVPQILDCFDIQNPEYYHELMLLGRWDYDLRAFSEAALLYQLTYERLLVDIFADEMGDSLFHQFADIWSFANVTLDRIMRQEESVWFDDVTTEAIETKQDIMRHAFAGAVAEWHTMDEDGRHWGAQHPLQFKHVLGLLPPVTWLLNRGPFPGPGDGKTVWKTEFTLLERPFASQIGPVFRKIDQPANRAASMCVLAGGQSGHWLQTHYADQLPLWLDGALRPCRITNDDLAVHTESKFFLVPASFGDKPKSK